MLPFLLLYSGCYGLETLRGNTTIIIFVSVLYCILVFIRVCIVLYNGVYSCLYCFVFVFVLYCIRVFIVLYSCLYCIVYWCVKCCYRFEVSEEFKTGVPTSELQGNLH